MSTYPFDRSLSNESDVLDYYLAAVEYRNTHKDQSADIAMHVFDKTHPLSVLTFVASEELQRLRDGFGALEAPGWSEDETKSLEESEDEVWGYVFNCIKNAKKARQFKDMP